MRYGIDFGTTRTLVARLDRGNYPVVGFHDTEGDQHDYLPTLAALSGQTWSYGFEALAAARQGATLLRSVKRVLGDPGTTVETTLVVAGQEVPLLQVLIGFLSALREELHDPSPQAVVSVPAHAHGVQRFLTLEAFRRAGFEVLALINEPSAAGFEFTHRLSQTVSPKRSQVLVYDLGGGTFDASLVAADGGRHEVIGTVGVNRLGGDDFDLVLAELALERAGRTAGDLGSGGLDRLLDECREAKERLTPQTRRLLVEVDEEPVVIAVDDFYQATSGLVDRSLAAMEALVAQLPEDSLTGVAGLYLVGGGSGLPLVPRVLRERFGRRVHRSPYPAASTAIGLAIAADPDAGYTLTDRLSRGFGVFREIDAGRALGFDEVVSAQQTLPGAGEQRLTRRYQAAHNIGWFRYVEYADRDADAQPRDLVPFAEVVFPFDPALQHGGDLSGVPVVRVSEGHLIEEAYAVDASGMVSVSITDLVTGFTRSFGLS